MAIAVKFNTISKVQSFSFSHNNREKEPRYLLDDKYRLNNYTNDYQNPNDYITEIKENYKKFKGRKLQAKTNMLDECIIAFGKDEINALIKQYNNANIFHKLNDKELRNKINAVLHEKTKEFSQHLKSKYGYEILQVSTHGDEGYLKDNNAQYNIHSHILMGNVNKQNYTTCRRQITKLEFSKIQDKIKEIATADILGHNLSFKRGEKGQKIALNHHDFKIYAKNIEGKKEVQKTAEFKLNAKNMELIENHKKLIENNRQLIEENKSLKEELFRKEELLKNNADLHKKTVENLKAEITKIKMDMEEKQQKKLKEKNRDKGFGMGM